MLGVSKKESFVSWWLRVSFRQKDVGRVASGKGETTCPDLSAGICSLRFHLPGKLTVLPSVENML